MKQRKSALYVTGHNFESTTEGDPMTMVRRAELMLLLVTV